MRVPHLDTRRVRRLRRSLLGFYDAARRDLPWRQDPEPYRIWVSEIMLQQTRAAVVIPFYERWITRFPTVQALAAAPLDDVLLAWQGLGYYSRARNLHCAARLVRDRGGVLPRDPAPLRLLPGIGEYTAGAIASIAFGVPAPAVDGNVRRVLARLLDVDALPRGTARAIAATLVPPERPGDFNQALMELGATICTPRSPACEQCPLRALCLAFSRGTQLERPARRPRKAAPRYHVGTAVLVARGPRLLLVRRPENGLLAGLWAFPGEYVRPGESPGQAAARAARKLGFIVSARAGSGLGAIAHAFTHRRETYHAFRFAVRRSPPPRAPNPEFVWASPPQFDTLALPAAQRRILSLVLPRRGHARGN